MKIDIAFILFVLISNTVFSAYNAPLEKEISINCINLSFTDSLMAVGSKWFYKSTSNQNTDYYGTVKEIANILPNNVLEIRVTSFFSSQTTSEIEYWLMKDQKFYKNNSIEYLETGDEPIYNFNLPKDTSYWGGALARQYHQFDTTLFGKPFRTQMRYSSNYFPRLYFGNDNYDYSAESLGIYKSRYRNYGSGYSNETNSELIGLLVNGTVIGDTILKVTQVDEHHSTITQFNLFQNYPNPFNPTTRIIFSIRNRGFVSLKIYDVLGREITTLLNDIVESGRYEKLFDATRLPSGVYYYSLKTQGFGETKAMILIK